MKTKPVVGFILALAFAGSSVAEDIRPDVVAVTARLKQLYPTTQFKEINRSPLPGVYEVVMGRNVAYVEESGRFFIFGHLFDMKEQKDLSADKVATAGLERIDFASLPLQDAIVTVKGNGSRKLAVFSDPDCPYCKQLDAALAKTTDVTIYTFLLPLEGLHPDARRKAIGVWCAKDRAKAWDDLMTRGVVSNESCQDNPIARNAELAGKLGITGTPTIVFGNGTLMPGAPQAEQLNTLLGSAK